ncbi:MAG: HIT domain-containing protein, partial [Elusimicrobia bacterium]|nr:HIT domain-containing protein [Elusimicrobiota bacterium]
MPEFRQNLATKDWVVIDSEHLTRPEDLSRKSPPPAVERPCPFCPGGAAEKETPLAASDAERGLVRVFADNRPVLTAGAKAPARHALYRSLPATGLHEVIVDSPAHAHTLGTMPPEQARASARVWRERFRAALSNDRVSLTVLFQNRGPAAGASLSHPHTQLVGSSLVPSHIRHRMDEASRYYEAEGACVFCRMLETELKDQVRLVEENDHFAAFVLYAALSPFHIWVLPKRHTASFGDVNDKEVDSFADILQRLCRRLDAALGSPSYSFVVQSTPLDRGTTEAFHWYLSLIVRVGGPSGFQLGSGMYSNAVLPEDAARFLRAAKA